MLKTVGHIALAGLFIMLVGMAAVYADSVSGGASGPANVVALQRQGSTPDGSDQLVYTFSEGTGGPWVNTGAGGTASLTLSQGTVTESGKSWLGGSGTYIGFIGTPYCCGQTEPRLAGGGTLPANASTNVTISMWVNPRNVMISGSGSRTGLVWNSFGWYVAIKSNGLIQIQGICTSGGTSFGATQTSTAMATGQWHHIGGVFTSDGVGAKLYIDGALQTTSSQGSCSGSLKFDGSNWTLGGQGATQGMFTIDGAISDLRIANTARAASYFSTLYAQTNFDNSAQNLTWLNSPYTLGSLTLTGTPPVWSDQNPSPDAPAVLTITGAAGSLVDGSNATTAGKGSLVSIITGAGGGAANSTANARTGGASGTWTIKTGTGGSLSSGTANNTGGASGSITIQTGDGGAAANSSASGVATGGNSGNLVLDTGAVGAGSGGATNANGTPGTISLGATNAGAITISRSGQTTTVAGNLTVSGTLTDSGAPAGSWAAETIGLAVVNQNYTGAFRQTSPNATKFRNISCSWGTAGVGGTTGYTVSVVNTTDSSTLCTCTLGACTTAANTPLSCDCNTASLTAKNYTLKTGSTADCATEPQNIICNVEMLQP